MRRRLAFLLALACMFCAAPAMAAEGAMRTTVLVYMSGSDLESVDGSATADIQEMLRANVPADGPLTVLVQTGGAKKWQLDGHPEKKNCLYRISGDDCQLLEAMEQQDTLKAELLRLAEEARHDEESDDDACCCQDHQVNPGPMPIRAMLNYVIDSCCTTEDICKEITVDITSIFDPDELCVGQTVNVDLAGDIMFKEVSRCKDDCTCLSTVRFAIPVRIFGNTGHGCGCKFIDRDICVVRSAKLCCAGDSQLTTFNSRVLAISAVISAIECDQVTICLCILFRSCLQQIILREFTWEATPVCVWDNCNDSRKHLFDSCDLLCGCTETGGKTCPSCG